MLHCTWMMFWIANDTRLFLANCFPTDRVISNWNRCSHIHRPIYLLHWNMDQKTEIRSYIKCRIRLNIDSKQIFNELCGIYGPQTISIRTVFRWVKAIKAGKFSELLKTYKRCNSWVISNLLTGDETWVHIFEPQRRTDNKQWKRKIQKRPCIAKRTMFEKDVVRNFL